LPEGRRTNAEPHRPVTVPDDDLARIGMAIPKRFTRS
jgi:hypothetical protein